MEAETGPVSGYAGQRLSRERGGDQAPPEPPAERPDPQATPELGRRGAPPLEPREPGPPPPPSRLQDGRVISGLWELPHPGNASAREDGECAGHSCGRQPVQ